MKRVTKQRLAIHDCLQEACRPLTIEEILKEASTTIPELNISTIYRNLKILVEEGKIGVVEVPGGPLRYEIVQTGHCHHFLCKACDRLYPIATCPKDLAGMIPEGFKMTCHSITLSGVCKGCRLIP